jgi:hypothetical protein
MCTHAPIFRMPNLITLPQVRWVEDWKLRLVSVEPRNDATKSEMIIMYCEINGIKKILEILVNQTQWFYLNKWNTVNREIFAALKVGEFAFFQLAVDKIPRLLQKFNG